MTKLSSTFAAINTIKLKSKIQELSKLGAPTNLPPCQLQVLWHTITEEHLKQYKYKYKQQTQEKSPSRLWLLMKAFFLACEFLLSYLSLLGIDRNRMFSGDSSKKDTSPFALLSYPHVPIRPSSPLTPDRFHQTLRHQYMNCQRIQFNPQCPF